MVYRNVIPFVCFLFLPGASSGAFPRPAFLQAHQARFVFAVDGENVQAVCAGFALGITGSLADFFVPFRLVFAVAGAPLDAPARVVNLKICA